MDDFSKLERYLAEFRSSDQQMTSRLENYLADPAVRSRLRDPAVQLRHRGAAGDTGHQMANSLAAKNGWDQRETKELLAASDRGRLNWLDDEHYMPAALLDERVPDAWIQRAARLRLWRRRQAILAVQRLLQTARELQAASGRSALDAAKFHDFTGLLHDCLLAPEPRIEPAAGAAAAAGYTHLGRALLERVGELVAEAADEACRRQDPFRHAAAYADALLLARCACSLYSVFAIPLHDLGNGAVFEEAGHGQPGFGGALLDLLRCLQSVSDRLYGALDHSDSNPLFELLWTLLAALLAAVGSPADARVDFSVPIGGGGGAGDEETDEGDEEADGRSEADASKPVLVRVLEAAAQAEASFQKAAAVRASPDAVARAAALDGAPGRRLPSDWSSNLRYLMLRLERESDAGWGGVWRHRGAHAAVCLVLGLAFYGTAAYERAVAAQGTGEAARRDAAAVQDEAAALMADGDLDDASAGGDTPRGGLHGGRRAEAAFAPPQSAGAGEEQDSEALEDRRRCLHRTMLRLFRTAFAGRGLHFLARVVAAPSFSASPLTREAALLPRLQDAVRCLLRYDLSFAQVRDQRILADAGAGGGGAGRGGVGAGGGGGAGGDTRAACSILLRTRRYERMLWRSEQLRRASASRVGAADGGAAGGGGGGSASGGFFGIAAAGAGGGLPRGGGAAAAAAAAADVSIDLVRLSDFAVPAAAQEGFCPPDCLEDLLVLQTLLARAAPALACGYWCLRGPALDALTDSSTCSPALAAAAALPQAYNGPWFEAAGVGTALHATARCRDPAHYVGLVLAALEADERDTKRDVEEVRRSALDAASAAAAAAAGAGRGGGGLWGGAGDGDDAFGDFAGSGGGGFGLGGGGSGAAGLFSPGGGAGGAAGARARVPINQLSLGGRGGGAGSNAAAAAGAGGQAPLGAEVDRLLPDAMRAAIEEETAALTELHALAARFLAAVGSGPLCADGRTCADHLLAFCDEGFRRDRAAALERLLGNVKREQLLQMQRDGELHVLQRGAEDASGGAGGGVDGPAGGAATATPADVRAALSPDTLRRDNGALRLARQPSRVTPRFTLGRQVALLAQTASELDGLHTSLRVEYWGLRRRLRAFREERARQQSARAGMFYGMYGQIGDASGGVAGDPDPPVPTRDPPAPDELVGRLQLLIALASAPATRARVLKLRVPLPAPAREAAEAEARMGALMARLRSQGADPTLERLAEAEDALRHEAAAGGYNNAGYGVAPAPAPGVYGYGAGAAAPSTLAGVDGSGQTDVLTALFHLLRLSVPTTVKAAIFTLLERLAHERPAALTIRDKLEEYQVLQTQGGTTGAPGTPTAAAAAAGAPGAAGAGLGSGGVKQELEAVETGDRLYDATIAYAGLLRTLHAVVPMHGLGSRWDAGRGRRVYKRLPGMHPHLHFIVEAVLLRADRRPYRETRPADRWKVALAGLGLLRDVVHRYYVAHPAPQPLVQAIAATGAAAAAQPGAGFAAGGRAGGAYDGGMGQFDGAGAAALQMLGIALPDAGGAAAAAGAPPRPLGFTGRGGAAGGSMLLLADAGAPAGAGTRAGGVPAAGSDSAVVIPPPGHPLLDFVREAPPVPVEGLQRLDGGLPPPKSLGFDVLRQVLGGEPLGAYLLSVLQGASATPAGAAAAASLSATGFVAGAPIAGAGGALGVAAASGFSPAPYVCLNGASEELELEAAEREDSTGGPAMTARARRVDAANRALFAETLRVLEASSSTGAIIVAAAKPAPAAADAAGAAGGAAAAPAPPEYPAGAVVLTPAQLRGLAPLPALSPEQVTADVARAAAQAAQVAGIGLEILVPVSSSSSSLGVGAATGAGAGAGGAAGGVVKRTLSDAELAACARLAETKSAEAIREGLGGGAGGGGGFDDPLPWRERVMTAALSVIDGILARDAAFIAGYKYLVSSAQAQSQRDAAAAAASGNGGGGYGYGGSSGAGGAGGGGVASLGGHVLTLTPFAETLYRAHALPLIAHLAGTPQRCEIGVLASRIMYRLSVQHSGVLQPHLLVGQLMFPRLAGVPAGGGGGGGPGSIAGSGLALTPYDPSGGAGGAFGGPFAGGLGGGVGGAGRAQAAAGMGAARLEAAKHAYARSVAQRQGIIDRLSAALSDDLVGGAGAGSGGSLGEAAPEGSEAADEAAAAYRARVRRILIELAAAASGATLDPGVLAAVAAAQDRALAAAAAGGGAGGGDGFGGLTGVAAAGGATLEMGYPGAADNYGDPHEAGAAALLGAAYLDGAAGMGGGGGGAEGFGDGYGGIGLAAAGDDAGAAYQALTQPELYGYLGRPAVAAAQADAAAMRLVDDSVRALLQPSDAVLAALQPATLVGAVGAADLTLLEPDARFRIETAGVPLRITADDGPFGTLALAEGWRSPSGSPVMSSAALVGGVEGEGAAMRAFVTRRAILLELLLRSVRIATAEAARAGALHRAPSAAGASLSSGAGPANSAAALVSAEQAARVQSLVMGDSIALTQAALPQRGVHIAHLLLGIPASMVALSPSAAGAGAAGGGGGGAGSSVRASSIPYEVPSCLKTVVALAGSDAMMSQLALSPLAAAGVGGLGASVGGGAAALGSRVVEPGFMLRRPRVAELCARLLASLLEDPRIRGAALAFLQAVNGREARDGRRFFLSRLANCGPFLQAALCPPPAAPALLPAQQLYGAGIGDSDAAAAGAQAQMASAVIDAVATDTLRHGGATTPAVGAAGAGAAAAAASNLLLGAPRTAESLVPLSIRQSVSFRHLFADYCAGLSVDAHVLSGAGGPAGGVGGVPSVDALRQLLAGLQLQPLEGSAAAAAPSAAAAATGGGLAPPPPQRGAAPASLHARSSVLIQLLRALPLRDARPGERPELLGSVLSLLEGPEALASLGAEAPAQAAAAPSAGLLAPSRYGSAATPLGPRLSLGCCPPQYVQTYSLDVVQALLRLATARSAGSVAAPFRSTAAAGAAATAAGAGAVSAYMAAARSTLLSTLGQASTRSLLQALPADATQAHQPQPGAADPAAQIAACLRWTVAYNTWALQLQAAHRLVSAWADTTLTLLYHCLPDPDPSVQASVLPVAQQAGLRDTLCALAEELLGHILGIAPAPAPTAASAAAAAGAAPAAAGGGAFGGASGFDSSAAGASGLWAGADAASAPALPYTADSPLDDTPALLLQPLTHVLLHLLLLLRQHCPSVPLAEGQVKLLLRRITQLLVSRDGSAAADAAIAPACAGPVRGELYCCLLVLWHSALGHPLDQASLPAPLAAHVYGRAGDTGGASGMQARPGGAGFGGLLFGGAGGGAAAPGLFRFTPPYQRGSGAGGGQGAAPFGTPPLSVGLLSARGTARQLATPPASPEALAGAAAGLIAGLSEVGPELLARACADATAARGDGVGAAAFDTGVPGFGGAGATGLAGLRASNAPGSRGILLARSDDGIDGEAEGGGEGVLVAGLASPWRPLALLLLTALFTPPEAHASDAGLCAPLAANNAAAASLAAEEASKQLAALRRADAAAGGQVPSVADAASVAAERVVASLLATAGSAAGAGRGGGLGADDDDTGVAPLTLSSDTRRSLARLRGAWLRSMHASGQLHALVAGLTSLDDDEAEAVALLQQARAAQAAAAEEEDASAGMLEAYGGVEGAGATVSGRRRAMVQSPEALVVAQDALSQRKRLRLASGRGVGVGATSRAAAALLLSRGAGAGAVLRASAAAAAQDVPILQASYVYTLQLLATIATERAGAAALLDRGALAAVAGLRWPMRAQDTLAGTRALVSHLPPAGGAAAPGDAPAAAGASAAAAGADAAAAAAGELDTLVAAMGAAGLRRAVTGVGADRSDADDGWDAAGAGGRRSGGASSASASSSFADGSGAYEAGGSLSFGAVLRGIWGASVHPLADFALNMGVHPASLRLHGLRASVTAAAAAEAGPGAAATDRLLQQAEGAGATDGSAVGAGAGGEHLSNALSQDQVAVSALSPRLLPLLSLLASLQAAKPSSAAHAGLFFAWLRATYVLLDRTVRATGASHAASSTTTVPALRLARAYLHLLSGVAAVPGALEAGTSTALLSGPVPAASAAAPSAGGVFADASLPSQLRSAALQSPLDGPLADSLVLQLLARFAGQQRRADASAQAALRRVHGASQHAASADADADIAAQLLADFGAPAAADASHAAQLAAEAGFGAAVAATAGLGAFGSLAGFTGAGGSSGAASGPFGVLGSAGAASAAGAPGILPSGAVMPGGIFPGHFGGVLGMLARSTGAGASAAYGGGRSGFGGGASRRMLGAAPVGPYNASAVHQLWYSNVLAVSPEERRAACAVLLPPCTQRTAELGSTAAGAAVSSHHHGSGGSGGGALGRGLLPRGPASGSGASGFGAALPESRFQIAAAAAGEGLAAAAAAYCRVRAAQWLKGPRASAYGGSGGLAASLAAGGAGPQQLLFLDPSHDGSAPGGAGASAQDVRSFWRLLAAVEQAALSLQHARAQLDVSVQRLRELLARQAYHQHSASHHPQQLAAAAAAAASSAAGASGQRFAGLHRVSAGYSPAAVAAALRGAVSRAIGALRLSAGAVTTSRFTFENLLATWLAHSTVREVLRLPAEDVAELAEAPRAPEAISRAFADSPFARAVLRQLKALGRP